MEAWQYAMTNVRDMFDAYVSDRRKQAIELFRLEQFAHLIRYTPDLADVEGLVTFARLNPANAGQQIIEQIDYFCSRKIDFEWKVYEFDEPTNLCQLLIAQGFAQGEVEVLMVHSLEGMAQGMAPEAHSSREWRILKVGDEQGVRDVVDVQERVWSRKFPWLCAQLTKRVMDPGADVSVYCAYIDGAPVGTGWTDFPAGSRYAELHGGAVLKEWRGRHIYTDLYRVRVAEATRRNYGYIAVDAGPMSRPVLERLGFLPVCETTPMRFKVASIRR
jgi:hypothetical protein